MLNAKVTRFKDNCNLNCTLLEILVKKNQYINWLELHKKFLLIIKLLFIFLFLMMIN